MSTPVWQLRTSENKTIRDLVKELSQSILESIEREIDFSDSAEHCAYALERPVLDALFPYVNAYDACGKNIVCSAAIESISCPDFEDHIYILKLPEGVDGLVKDIVTKALTSYYYSLCRESFEDLWRRVETVVRRTIKTHLYTNPQCGNHDICMISSPVDPWSAYVVR